MNKADNQRHRETERKLREALLQFLMRGREPTVGDLCEAAQINRSTFYRHFKDIPDLMEKTESEIQKGLVLSVSGEGSFLERLASSEDVLVPLVRYIGENRYFYRVYMHNRTNLPMQENFRIFWEKHIRPLFEATGVMSETHMRYYFLYVQAGCAAVLKKWLDQDCTESPEEIASVLYRMLRFTDL